MMKPKPITPLPGPESVWEYPRPARLERTTKRLKVVFNGVTIADTTQGYRALETSHAPTYYLPPSDIAMDYLQHTGGSSMCEWKGAAKYYKIVVGDKTADKAAWYYPTPTADFKPIRGYVAFYARAMDGCYVAGELAQPQPGGFYGGWVTSDLAGPIKGEPGSWWW
ncbi:MAG: DUF427 domain-containing protein [Sphaerospermopsis sp. SIO1G2]|nr:DUF427 domain-containing protein [Sphaerospermopsis sp. SIO1G2]